MTAESGTRSRLSAWSEVMMRPEISRPRRQYDALAAVERAVDVHGVPRDEAAPAVDRLDAAGRHQPGEPLVHPLDYSVLVRVEGDHVDALERPADADRGALAHLVGHFGGVQQGLRRYAASMQARAPDLVAFDERHLRTQLRGAHRGRIAAASRAEHNDVVVQSLGHVPPLRVCHEDRLTSTYVPIIRLDALFRTFPFCHVCHLGHVS